MTNSILSQIGLASKNLSEKIQTHFSEMELVDCLIGLETLKEQIKLRSIQIMSQACAENDFEAFKQNLAEYMSDSYNLAVSFGAGEEADVLRHLIFKDEESIKVYWEYQCSKFNKEMKAAKATLDETIESLMSPNVA